MRTLTFQFKDIVEKVYSLPIDEKLELKNLLEHNISEARRTEILANFKQSQEEEKSGKLIFASNADDLKKML